jgi:hypothetical protein
MMDNASVRCPHAHSETTTEDSHSKTLQNHPHDLTKKPYFDSATRTWIIANPFQCKELIVSSSLRPIAYAQDYAALQRRLGIDFSSLVFAFENIPLCLHGEPHARSRRRASEFLAARKASINARLPQAVATHLDVFRHEGRVEMMNDAVLPLAMLGQRHEVPLCQVFRLPIELFRAIR